MAGCHSLPLPTAQEICPHPLTEDAEVGRGKVLSRDCGIAIDPRAYAAHCCHLYLWLPSTSLQEDNKGLKGWSLVCNEAFASEMKDKVAINVKLIKNPIMYLAANLTFEPR